MTNPDQLETPQAAHRPSPVLRAIGMGMFLAGFLLFNATLFVGDYKINPQKLRQIENKIPSETASKLLPLANSSYGNQFEAVEAVRQAIDPDGDLADYQRTEYLFWIVKNSLTGPVADHTSSFLWITLLLAVGGGLLYILSAIVQPPGIKHDNIFFSNLKNRGLIGILLGSYLIGFYILLYWYPQYLVNAVILFDPLSVFIRNLPADRWFLYGTLYTLAVSVMGVRMFMKYRHSNYHLIRTASVIFFQFAFAFTIPGLLERFGKPGMDFKNAWPLNYTFFMDWNLSSLLSSGNLGIFMLFWGIILSVILVPLFTYFFGKRWYCSWVCGCGGLAETLGDPFRQLSDKSLKAWKVERWMIHSVLVFAVVMTVMQIANFTSNGALFGDYTWRINQWYGFLIGSTFAGVVGTGFYPLMGNRVWCRFGCPLAAILGLVQKLRSRFVITTNGGQCISCGNCSTYCEMGIDVRWYAQRGQNIIRSSCVGCGVCSAVCPRGVLKLENGDVAGRYNITLDDEILAKLESMKNKPAA